MERQLHISTVHLDVGPEYADYMLEGIA